MATGISMGQGHFCFITCSEDPALLPHLLSDHTVMSPCSAGWGWELLAVAAFFTETVQVPDKVTLLHGFVSSLGTIGEKHAS